MSNFLGDVGGETARSWIISSNEVFGREEQILQKDMNYRADPRLSVFVLSAGPDAPHASEWDEDTELLMYEGHDATTAGKDKKSVDQPMYRDQGTLLSDNGKFYKEAVAFKDGVRKEPHQIQMYERIDAGVWFDKGIFNLLDAAYVAEGGRKVFKFYLAPAGANADEDYHRERMLSPEAKVAAWQKHQGRCAICGFDSGLHFNVEGKNIQLVCSAHYSRKSGELL